MSSPLVTINLVVLNGEKYIQYCLDAVKNQTYSNLEINIFDNGSTDKTKEIIREWQMANGKWQMTNFIENKINYGMWGGQEKALDYSYGKYIIALSVDVLFAPDTVEKSVVVMEKDERIGALQAKIYQYDINKLQTQTFRPELQEKIIDTVGFGIFRSRKIINLGHGELDNGQYDKEMEVFGVEGAAPIFRREALEDSVITGEIVDHDMFWYGDDIDLVWRMRLFGWKQIYSPPVIMYHDRSTTKGVSKSWLDYFKRTGERKKIPALKKRLDWRNKRLARLKNDYWINVLQNLPRILRREIQELGYAVLFEPSVLLEIPKLISLTPKMFKKRKEIMLKAEVGPEQMAKWFI
ncbi:MAG: glycosyltransferase family 2 protein [Candidatus Yanofskybacteria bacterium]|nr:glycosyltransferase family 2 protein [Candidatus Yanofskybacteria bacterium]